MIGHDKNLDFKEQSFCDHLRDGGWLSVLGFKPSQLNVENHL